MGMRLITPATLEPISLADVKLNSRIDSSDEDTLITGVIIPAVRQKAEQYLQAAIMQRTVEQTLDSFPTDGDPWIEMPPAWNRMCGATLPLAMVSVKYFDAAGAQQTLDPSAYSLDDANWPFWLLPAYNTDWPDTQASANAVTIRYQTGYDAATKIPGDLRAWLLMTAGFLWENREAFVLDGKIAEIPNRFTDSLLDPYRVFRI